jgi:hypothetical protein
MWGLDCMALFTSTCLVRDFDDRWRDPEAEAGVDDSVGVGPMNESREQGKRGGGRERLGGVDGGRSAA